MNYRLNLVRIPSTQLLYKDKKILGPDGGDIPACPPPLATCLDGMLMTKDTILNMFLNFDSSVSLNIFTHISSTELRFFKDGNIEFRSKDFFKQIIQINIGQFVKL